VGSRGEAPVLNQSKYKIKVTTNDLRYGRPYWIYELTVWSITSIYVGTSCPRKAEFKFNPIAFHGFPKSRKPTMVRLGGMERTKMPGRWIPMVWLTVGSAASARPIFRSRMFVLCTARTSSNMIRSESNKFGRFGTVAFSPLPNTS
jgi:hypothetical protein